MGCCNCNCMNKQDNTNNNDTNNEIIVGLKEKDNNINNILKFEMKDDKDMTDLEAGSLMYKFNSNRFPNSTILIGLANIGAFAYMNPILQCLSNTDKLTNYFLNEFKCNKDDDTKKVSYQYYDLLQHLWDKYNETKEYAPNNFEKLLSEINPLFSGKNPVYSKDFLNYLLEILHKELNEASKEEEINNMNNVDDIKQNEEKIKQYFFKDFASKNKSIISDLFCFSFETKSQCSICKFI